MLPEYTPENMSTVEHVRRNIGSFLGSPDHVWKSTLRPPYMVLDDLCESASGSRTPFSYTLDYGNGKDVADGVTKCPVCDSKTIITLADKPLGKSATWPVLAIRCTGGCDMDYIFDQLSVKRPMNQQPKEAPGQPAERPISPTQDDPPQVEDDPPLERLKDYGNYNPTDWIIRNWIPRSETTILAGPGGIGKSTLKLQIAAAVATGGGIDVFHEPDSMKPGEVFKTERQAHVMFLSWEDRSDVLKKRMNNLAEHPAIDLKLLEQYLHVFDMRGRGPLYQPSRGSRHISTIATSTPLLHEITAYAKTFEAKMIVIDTIAAVFLSDENSRPLVRQFLNSMTAIADELNAAIVLLCHPPKQSGVQFSGSTDWVNGSRSALSFEYASGTNQPVLSVAKSNLGPRPDPIYFQDTYPYYVAGEREIPEAKESAPLRQCAGYEDFECDKETRGRAQRCPECKKIHDKLRWKKTHSS